MDFETIKNQILHPEDVTAQFDLADIQTNRKSAIAASIPFLFWIPLISCKDSPYGRHCANQGLILFILTTVLSIVETVAGVVLGLIPFGSVLSFIVHVVFSVVKFYAFLVLLVGACRGQVRKIPFLSNLINVF